MNRQFFAPPIAPWLLHSRGTTTTAAHSSATQSWKKIGELSCQKREAAGKTLPYQSFNQVREIAYSLHQPRWRYDMIWLPSRVDKSREYGLQSTKSTRNDTWYPPSLLGSWRVLRSNEYQKPHVRENIRYMCMHKKSNRYTILAYSGLGWNWTHDQWAQLLKPASNSQPRAQRWGDGVCQKYIRHCKCATADLEALKLLRCSKNMPKQRNGSPVRMKIGWVDLLMC